MNFGGVKPLSYYSATIIADYVVFTGANLIFLLFVVIFDVGFLNKHIWLLAGYQMVFGLVWVTYTNFIAFIFKSVNQTQKFSLIVMIVLVYIIPWLSNYGSEFLFDNSSGFMEQQKAMDHYVSEFSLSKL